MLFGNYNICRIVVGISVDERTIGEGTERIAFVLPLLCCHPRLMVDNAVKTRLVLFGFNYLFKFESSVRCVKQVPVHEFKVVYAPGSLIAERAVTGLEHRKERREEIIFANLFRLFLASEVFCHTVIGRIVVHITHTNDLDTGIFLLHHLRVLVHYLSATAPEVVTTLLSAST